MKAVEEKKYLLDDVASRMWKRLADEEGVVRANFENKVSLGNKELLELKNRLAELKTECDAADQLHIDGLKSIHRSEFQRLLDRIEHERRAAGDADTKECLELLYRFEKKNMELIAMKE